MKLLLSKSLAFVPWLAACTIFSAHGQQVTFQGTVYNASCTATVQTGGGTVTLPPATVSQLGSQGATANETPFVMAVTGCGAQPGISVKTYFYNTTAGAVSNGRLNTIPDRGWQFQLLPATGATQLEVGTSPTPPAYSANSDLGYSIASGTANINYRVRYFRSSTSSITPGAASATANYVLQYN